MLIMVQGMMQQVMIAKDLTEGNFNQRKNFSIAAVSRMVIEIAARVLQHRIEAGAISKVLKMQAKCHLKKCSKIVMTSLMIPWKCKI